MLTVAEITTVKRSAAMAPLSPESVRELLDACEQMAKERAEITAILETLPATFAEVRAALNRLHQIVQ
jgi:DNA-binding GntR family transcriptional regulator